MLVVVGAVLPIVVFSTIMVVLVARQPRAGIEAGLLDTARALSVAVDRELTGAITTLEPVDADRLAAVLADADGPAGRPSA